MNSLLSEYFNGIIVRLSLRVIFAKLKLTRIIQDEIIAGLKRLARKVEGSKL